MIEHLPDYEKVLDKFLTLVKPGGKIFLDGSADTKKYNRHETSDSEVTTCGCAEDVNFEGLSSDYVR